jgi:L-fuconolactonase
MTTRLIDIHPHIISGDITRYPLDPLGGARSSWSADHPASFEQLVAAMNESGVDKAAIVHSSTTYGFDNSYLADSVATDPKRVTGVFSVDLMANDAPQRIRYWVDRGLGGLRIFTSGSTMGQQPWLRDERIYAGWDAASEIGLSICVQMTAAAVPDLEKLLKRSPRTKVVIDHMMRPPIAEGAPYPGAQFLFDLARYPNLYLKITSRNTSDALKDKVSPDIFFKRLVQAFGPERLAWGSNYPATCGSLKDMIDELDQCIAFLPERDRHWIKVGTAQVLYPQLAD